MAGKLRYFQQRDGRFFARIAVPQRLRGIVGKTELIEPLGPDRREAIKRHAIVVAQLMSLLDAAEKQLAGETAEPPAVAAAQALSDTQIAHANYELRLLQDMRSRLHALGSIVYGDSFDDGEIVRLRIGADGTATNAELEAAVGHRIDMFRSLGHTTVTKGTAEWRQLAMLLCASELEALARVNERNQGVMDGTTTNPILLKVEEAAAGPDPVSLSGLFNDYLAHLKGLGRSESTIYKWNGIYNRFCSHLEHDDARLVTKKDMREWRDELLKTHAVATVKRGHLAAINSAFEWAVAEDTLTENPVAGVKLPAAKTPVGRPKGFNDEEALKIIKLSRNYQPSEDRKGKVRETPAMTRAKQWLPMLCAFTGARVSEMAQLRKQDLKEEDGVFFLRITPDAGGNKSHHFRDVPIHEQLVQEGFLEVVASLQDGPLFYECTQPEGKYAKAKSQANRVATWLKKECVIPEKLSPNHAWRHRFQTLARRYSQSEMVANAICSHGKKDISHTYGDAELVTKKRVIDAMPAFDLKPEEVTAE